LRVKGGRTFYGDVLGILMLDTKFPRIPGDVGNAFSYEFPVRFKVVKGATVRKVVFEADHSLYMKFLDAAKELESEGVKAITTSCGFLSIFQDELAKSLKIPVFTSTLLIVPLAYKLTMGRVGIITANAKTLSKKHLERAGIDLERIPIAVAGLEEKEEFRRVILEDSDEADIEKLRKEVVEVAEELVSKYSDIKSLVFECHNLSPFSKDVHEKVGLPIFDFLSLAKFVYHVVVKRGFNEIIL
jgi:Asp/Glu/hydantoin racemase